MGRGAGAQLWQMITGRRSRHRDSSRQRRFQSRSVIQLTGSQFVAPGADGDFSWMIEQPEYADALFVFNDNEEQFRAYVDEPADDFGYARGGGNAAIRPYRGLTPARAAGIPTGADGAGYSELNEHVRHVIDESLAVISAQLVAGRYRRLIYSAADESGALGTGIFEVGEDVKQYIVAGLRRLAA